MFQAISQELIALTKNFWISFLQTIISFTLKAASSIFYQVKNISVPTEENLDFFYNTFFSLSSPCIVWVTSLYFFLALLIVNKIKLFFTNQEKTKYSQIVRSNSLASCSFRMTAIRLAYHSALFLLCKLLTNIKFAIGVWLLLQAYKDINRKLYLEKLFIANYQTEQTPKYFRWLRILIQIGVALCFPLESQFMFPLIIFEFLLGSYLQDKNNGYSIVSYVKSFDENRYAFYHD